MNKYGSQVEDYRDDSMKIQSKRIFNEICKKGQDGVEAWVNYICQYHKFLGGDFCSEYTINDVVKRLLSKYYGTDHDVFMGEILPKILNNDRLLELMFQYAGCGIEKSIKPKFLACLIVCDKCESVYKIINYLCNNKNMIFISVGAFLCETYKYVVELLEREKNNSNSHKCEVSKKMKETLWDSLKFCYSSFDLAECKIPIICIITQK